MLVTRPHRSDVALAVVAGLAVDTVVRGTWSTWDVAWQSGVGPWLVTGVLVALLVLGALATQAPGKRASGASALTLLVFGPYLALQMLFLQSPAFVASSGHAALATATAVVLVGDVVAIAAVAVTVVRPPSRLGVAVTGCGLAVAGWLLPSVTGTTAGALLLLGQFLATALLAVVVGTPAVARSRGTLLDGLGIVGGSLGFALTIFLYQLHYDNPLPMSNRWLPAVAGSVVAVGALVAVPRRAVRAERSPRATLILAGGVAVAAVVIAGLLAIGEPDLELVDARPVALRVVTYNPHEAVARDGRLDPSAVASVARRLHPDVFVLEEAGRGWPLSSATDLGEWLKRHLGMPYVWAPAADHQFGNLLFSRVPILSARVVALPRGSGAMRRSAVVARVGPVRGTIVTVVGTHLQNGSSAAAKATRVEELRVLFRDLGPLRHMILAGDLNSDPGSAELHTLLAAGFTTTQPTERCTLKTSNANCVDWILVTPDLVQSPVRTLPVDTFDHRPLVATVRSP